jgi:hypothetical protein
MPGSGTTARVIKDPKEASQPPWQSIRHPSANCPTCLLREPCWSHTTPREDEPFSQTAHGPLNHGKRAVQKGQHPTFVKKLGTSPPFHTPGREASQQLLPDMTPCLLSPTRSIQSP